MILKLTEHEIMQFQYILPIQGSLQTLELVQKILDKINIKTAMGEKDLKEIDFDNEESELLKTMIDFLDKNQKLSIQSLSLAHKIIKQEKKDHDSI